MRQRPLVLSKMLLPRPGQQAIYQLRDNGIGISPTLFAKRLDRRPGRADKRTQNPGHLNGHEDVDALPRPEHLAMSAVSQSL